MDLHLQKVYCYVTRVIYLTRYCSHLHFDILQMVEFVCKAFKRHVYFVIIFYKVIFENQQKQSIKNRCFSKSGEECPMSAGFTKAMLCK